MRRPGEVREMTPSHEVSPAVPAGGHRTRLVLFSASDPQYAGRALRRARILALQPVDQTLHLSAPQLRSPGGHWEYLLADDSPLFVRAEDAITSAQAQKDALMVFASRAALRPVYVRDPETGHLSWWLARKRSIVLVASRLWLPSQRAAVARAAQRAIAALSIPPPWGDYSG